MAVMTRDVKEEIRKHESDVIAVVRALGGSVGKYRRDRQRGIRAIVAEVYSPPRVTAAAKLLPELKLIPGLAFDLTSNDVDGRAWNLEEKEMRDRAMKKLKAEELQLLVGSPICTAFSTWQRINNKIRDPMIVANELKRAKEHLDFCAELFREQIRGGGRVFST